MVFDVRGNGGGLLSEAVNVVNFFVPKGQEIVKTKGKFKQMDYSYRTNNEPIDLEIPLVVLVDEATASASEIVSGGLQDLGRATIKGKTSFGKGLVQEPIYFTDGSGIRLTVARFHTPSGRCIQKPYEKNDEYMYDILERYNSGEMVSVDSVKVDTSLVYYTAKGRKVYGGGGIIPDVFVPMDTTLATKFYIQCANKATTMRFASVMFDKYKSSLSTIEDFAALEQYLKSIDVEGQFLNYASKVDGITPKAGEWEASREYMLPQVNGLVGRFSKLGEEAFNRFYVPIDRTIQKAIENGGHCPEL